MLWSDSEWVKYVSNKNLETHVLKKGEELVGFYEQEYHPGSHEVELINLGVLKEFRGLKLDLYLSIMLLLVHLEKIQKECGFTPVV